MDSYFTVMIFFSLILINLPIIVPSISNYYETLFAKLFITFIKITNVPLKWHH